MISLEPLLVPVSELARQAGEAIMAVYLQADIGLTIKADHSPLTQADLQANQIICKGLENLTPKIPILTEEGGIPDFRCRQQWQYYWLIDPLDGTKEFIDKNDEFTVNIALIRQGQPILGVVYAPALDRLFWAAKGRGAYHRDSTGTQTLKTRAFDPHDLIVMHSRRHGGERFAAYTALLEGRGSNITLKALGSSLKMCHIAAGLADVYPRFGPTSEWDTAASQVIVEQAGGAIVNMAGKPLGYNTKDSVLNSDFIAVADVGAINHLLL